MKKYTIHILAGIAVVAVIIGIVLYDSRGIVEMEKSDDNGLVNVGGLLVSENDAENLQVEIVPDIEAIAKVPTPDVDRPIVIPSKYPQAFHDSLTAKITEAREILREHPVADNADTYNTWLALAVYYMQIDDYRGAEAVWLYLEEVYPGTQTITSANLGSLYHLQLKEYEKSEQYWRQAIESETPKPSDYIGLHELYRYSYKQNTSAAEDILLEGLRAFPKSAELMIRLAGYYIAIGRTADARVRYQQALVIAENLKNESLAETLRRELAAIE